MPPKREAAAFHRDVAGRAITAPLPSHPRLALNFLNLSSGAPLPPTAEAAAIDAALSDDGHHVAAAAAAAAAIVAKSLVPELVLSLTGTALQGADSQALVAFLAVKLLTLSTGTTTVHKVALAFRRVNPGPCSKKKAILSTPYNF